ncbi:MAG: acyltransferase [Rikenellaceae bacterium]|jgi:putative hemolysin|nr:acyltransferase [Rikenellaceae bacterium]
MTKISVAGVLEGKAPKMYKWVPRPLVKWLARTVHEDDLNYVLENFAGDGPFEFLRRFFAYTGVTYETVGLDKLDPSERYIFASNHPFGGMDGMMLAERIGTHFGDVRVIVNDILMYLEPLRSIFVPVNKHGRQKGDYAVAFNETFEGSAPVLTFPAGLCSRCIANQVQDIEWRPNFVKRANQTGRLIVPVFVEGQLSKRFYRLAGLRKKLGIKGNVEMIYLPDEMFRQKGQHFKLIFGEPISPEVLREEGNYMMQAQQVRRMSYALVGRTPSPTDEETSDNF